MAITLRLVTGSVLTYGQVDANFSSLFYSASQSGSSLVFHTTGSIVQAATTTPFNLGLGLGTVATGQYSHAQGYNTVASGDYQHVQGQYNVASSAQSAFIIGNGTAEGSRSNLIFASGSKVQITGSLAVANSANVRENIFTGTTPPGGTSGGYFNIYNSISPSYSQFVFYSTDNADSDGFGNVGINANPEEGISIYASEYNGSNLSSIGVSKGQLLISNSLLQITSTTASLYSSNYFKIISPSVQITGSLITSGTILVGDTIVPGTPTYGSTPDVVIGKSTGGVLDIRNTNTNVATGDTLGIIQFTGKDDTTVGYTSSQIKATVSQSPGTGNGGGGILSFWTGIAQAGSSPTERMRITQAGNVLIGETLDSDTYKFNVTANNNAIIAIATTGSALVASSNLGIGVAASSMSGIGLQVDSFSGVIARFRSNTGYEQMKLFSNGNLLLNTLGTSGGNQADTGYKLYVGGTTNIDGNTTITGSVIIKDILTLTPRTTTPTPSPGMVIVSGSGVDQHIYCYLNSTWKQLD